MNKYYLNFKKFRSKCRHLEKHTSFIPNSMAFVTTWTPEVGNSAWMYAKGDRISNRT